MDSLRQTAIVAVRLKLSLVCVGSVDSAVAFTRIGEKSAIVPPEWNQAPDRPRTLPICRRPDREPGPAERNAISFKEQSSSCELLPSVDDERAAPTDRPTNPRRGRQRHDSALMDSQQVTPPAERADIFVLVTTAAASKLQVMRLGVLADAHRTQTAEAIAGEDVSPRPL